MPPGSYNKHHLIPKCKKGKETITIHKMCHNAIHSTFTDTQLKQRYNTIEALKSDEDIIKFVEWIQTKSPEYYQPTKMSNRKRSI